MATLLQRVSPPSRPEPVQAYWLPFQASELLVQEKEVALALLQGEEMASLRKIDKSTFTYICIFTG